MITIKNLKDMKNNTTNEFKAWVLSDILSQGSKQDIIDYLDNSKHGCESGTVSSLIYYKDTHKVFKKYFEDILEIIEEIKDFDGGFISNIEFSSNKLVWVAYDYTISNIISELED